MKIILVGATGFIGREVLAQCLRKDSITSIVVLTRRALPEALSKHGRVVSVVVKDFLRLGADVKEKMRGAEAAVWALRADTEEVEIEYPLAFAKVMREMLGNDVATFRYMHVSGVLAERDQEKKLWFLQDGRRWKGVAEMKLEEVAQQHSGWETYIARPSMVVSDPPGFLNGLLGWFIGAVGVDQLASAMLDIVENGSSQVVWQNADLVKHAQELEQAATNG